MTESSKQKSMPYEIYLTYKSSNIVPDYIWHQYNKFASPYKINFFDDNDCLDYLSDFTRTNQEFMGSLVDIYRSHPNGAHKADIWRYAILYEKGGIYFDIKTLLVKDLDKIFNHNSKIWYTVLSGEQHKFPEFNIHQGIIATPKNNPILKDALNLYIKTPVIDFQKYYWTACNQLYSICSSYYQSDLSTSIDKSKEYKIFQSPYDTVPDLLLMQERCSKQSANYKSDEKRYGLHCIIEDDIDEIVFNTRDTEYGQKW